MSILFMTMSWLQSRLQSERGAGMAEYALLLALIAAVVAGIAATLENTITGAFQAGVDAFTQP